jgi:methionyl-tRNA formyltransferase
MRVFLFIGFLRGYKLLKRLLERGETILGAYVFEEDIHERNKYAEDIESLCQVHQIPVKRKRRVGKEQAQEIGAGIPPEVIFCNGWRTILPDDVLAAAARGVVAAHDSLLPRLRGFAPTNWALLLGHNEVGVSLFRMTSGMDEGDLYFQESIPVKPSDALTSITDQIAELSVALFDKYLDSVREGALTATPQEHPQATYTCARTPDDGEIDWSSTTGDIVRFVRALGPPGPGAFTYYNRHILRILRATETPAPRRYEGRVPGRIIAISRDSIDVLSGDGVIRIEEVESAYSGICPPAKIIRSVRAQLGVRPSVEFDRIYSLIEELESQAVCMKERLTRLEEELLRLSAPDHAH